MQKIQTYTVTQKHIDNSNRYSSASTANPLAKAIREKLHRIVCVYKTGIGDYDTSSGRVVDFTLSKNAQTFLKNFYDGKKVKPITFTITPVR